MGHCEGDKGRFDLTPAKSTVPNKLNEAAASGGHVII